MAQNKTRATDVSPSDYIAAIEPAQKQADAVWLLELCEELTGQKAKMWGPSIIGSGSYRYKQANGSEQEICLVSFAARKAALVVYLGGVIPNQQQFLDKLGPHKMGKGCLYIKRLEQIDRKILKQLMAFSMAATRKKYPD